MKDASLKCVRVCSPLVCFDRANRLTMCVMYCECVFFCARLRATPAVLPSHACPDATVSPSFYVYPVEALGLYPLTLHESIGKEG